VNEKIIFHCLIVGFALCICGMATGCRSQPNITDVSEPTIIQFTENLGRIQEQNYQFAAIADNLLTGIESIEDRISNTQNGIESAQTDARGAEQDIDAAIQLFIEYKQRVDQFISDYRKLQNQIKDSN
jgi:predicted  nucleic acid-binding Zn-ribbon protein